MMKKLAIVGKKLLVLSLMLLAAFMVSLSSGPGVSAAHLYWPTTSPLPTPTPTATPVPTPVQQACQVDEVIFDQDIYSPGEAIGVTLRVVDYRGDPLVGANVWVEVTRQELAAQSTADVDSIDLYDRSGYYEGSYAQTDLPGVYAFSFTVVDPTGARFLPCTAEALVPVEDNRSQCEISVTSAAAQVEVGDPITLSAEVTVDGVPHSGARVAATVTRPDNSSGGSFDFTGGGPYIGVYADTDIPGAYAFEVSASHPDGEFLPCSTETPVEVSVEVGNTMVSVDPELIETTLCALQETTAIAVERVANLTGVELEISYDPTIIQVIDADPGQRGVQVRHDPLFDTASISRNVVDTRNGRIFFLANLLGGQAIHGDQNLIAIDWRPQNLGSSPVALDRVVLRGAGGQTMEAQTQNGAVEVDFVSSCAFGAVALQQRSDHRGVVVTNSTGQRTVTLPDGTFGIPASDTINFKFPSYLSARADLQPRMELEQVEEGKVTTVELGLITLLAGDVNGDDLVNILDLAQVAGNFMEDDPATDLNGDGLVNIFDLVAVASNYQLQGPRPVPQ